MGHKRGGWSVVQSIAVELDVALGAMIGVQWPDRIGQQFAVAEDWRDQWSELMGRPRPWPGVLGLLSLLADVEFEADYSKATLAMRELTLPVALQRAASYYAGYASAPEPTLPLEAQLIDLVSRGAQALDESIGLQRSRPGELGRVVAYEVERLVPLLRDGHLHVRFWHWLDRGYYEWYRPWREDRATLLATEEERALAGLGALEGEGPPSTGWLTPQHPLHNTPELQRAVAEQRVRVCFWVQPFGLFDSVAMGSAMVLLSFGEPGDAYTEFRQRAADLAHRLASFSDPTRLMILRMIRNYAKDNTQMAEFLGVARPAVSTHAKILREAGLISTTQEGRAARHTIDYRAIRQLFADLELFLDMPEEM